MWEYILRYSTDGTKPSIQVYELFVVKVIYLYFVSHISD